MRTQIITKTIFSGVCVFLLLPFVWLWLCYCCILHITAVFWKTVLPSFDYINRKDYNESINTHTICRDLHTYGLMDDATMDDEISIYNKSTPEQILAYKYIALFPLIFMQYSETCKRVAYWAFNCFWVRALNKNKKGMDSFLFSISQYLGDSLFIQKNYMLHLAYSNHVRYFSFLILLIPTCLVIVGELWLVIIYVPVLSVFVLYLENLCNGLDVKKTSNVLDCCVQTLCVILYFLSVIYYATHYDLQILDYVYILVLSLSVMPFAYNNLHDTGHSDSKLLYVLLSWVTHVFAYMVVHKKHHKGITKGDDVFLFCGQRRIVLSALLSIYYFYMRLYNNRWCFLLQISLQFASYTTLFLIDIQVLVVVLIMQYTGMFVYMLINFLQHYRLKGESKTNRSWDTINLFTNHVFNDLGRHASHHTKDCGEFVSGNYMYIGYTTQVVCAYLESFLGRVIETTNTTKKYLGDI